MAQGRRWGMSISRYGSCAKREKYSPCWTKKGKNEFFLAEKCYVAFLNSKEIKLFSFKK